MHFHGWALFGDAAIWRLACTSDDYQRCKRRLDHKVEEDFWKEHTTEKMVRQCESPDETCRYYTGKDYSI